jgi:Rv0078B-related antitoxin
VPSGGGLRDTLNQMTKEEIASARLRTAFDLFTAGERMMRQNLRRRHPDASAAEIEEMLWKWLMQRPGAEYGDGVGRPVTWPRKAQAS